ncbi:hypothetical protein O3P69_018588 [Scylla paramamosain]|uniref:Uncharacterized protein n=1 Tax=Scylla paramamosain TaxID=85552 RepID=A0AAW0T3R3_SCYPA
MALMCMEQVSRWKKTVDQTFSCLMMMMADRDYVQPAHVSSSDDEPLSPKKERHKRQRARVPAVTRVPQKATTSSVVPVLSDSSHHEQVKKPNKSYYLRDKKNFRWSLELLHTAVCEHRWDDAFRLLPCVITHTVPHLSLEFLWRVTDVITRNVPSLSVNDRKKFRSILHGMKLKTSMFLDILSQDLGEATDRDADELLQMIEDIQNQRQPPAQGIETRTGKRFKALSDGYIGLVHYHRWKSSLLNAMSFSQALDDDSCSVSICESQGTANTSKNEIARTAHWFLKKALSGLIEPCDWFMLQFLELEKELYGQESAISVLERYKSDPCRAPAHHLAYHFYKNLVPGSVMEQLVELECISRACPDDPLVLEEVNLYLHSLEHGGLALDRAMMWMRSAESDSGQESSDECPSPGPTDAFCTLKTTGKVEVLMRCLMLLVAMLDYPAHTWDLQPWQKLTQVLTKFYQAWVRCWSCLACRNTRKRIHRLAMTVVPLWKHFVWKEPPANLPLEQARVLFHHVFVAFIFNYNEEYMSHSLSVLWASGHLQLREELMNLINFPGAFLRHFSLLAKKYRKRVEGISLRFLSQTASQNKRAIQQNQERTQNTSEVATITSSQDLDQETQKEGLHDSEFPETQSQMDTSINISTEDRHSDKAQQEEDEVVHRKQNEAVQEKENDKTKGKQNEEVQGKDKSEERQCDETDVGKQTESIREEWKSEEQVLSSIGQGRQGEVTLESLEIDVGSVFNQEYSHSSLSSLTAGQRERGSTSSPDEPAPVSQCGQGFFLTQERESGEVLLSLDGKESGSQKPEHGDIKVITLDELEKLDLEDLDCNLLRRLAEQHYCESIKSEENSSEVQNWHSDKTPDGLLESVSMHQDPKEGSNATICVTEEETLLEAENWVQVQRKPDEPQQESPSEERCNLQTEVQDSEENSSGSEHKSLKKSLDKIKSTAQKVLEPETVAPKEHGTDSKALPKTTQAFERRIPTNKHDETLPPQDGQLQTPSTRHPNMPWFMLHVEDLPTPSMQDIIKHSDTSTPITSGKQRHRPSGTPKDTRGSTKHSRVPHYPASWLEGLPLPGTGNNTPSRKSKDIDAHEAKFKIPEGVLSSASVTRKASRKSKKILRDPEVENPDAALSGTSRGKTEKSSRKRKKKVLAYTDEGIIDVKGLEDNISLCGKDREEGAEPGIETSVPIMEEAEMIDSKQESETRNDVCTSVTDGMDDLPIPRDTEAGLEVSPERDTSSMIETDMNILESDGQQCVQDIHYGTDTDELKDLPPNNEDKGDGLEINENGKEAPSRKRTRADRISATESNTDITGEGQKPESKKEADRVEKIKKKLKKKKKSSDESPSHSKVTGSSPATTQEESVRGSILSPVMKDVQTTESESVREDLTVTTSKRKQPDSDKRELARHGSRHSKRQKLESSRLGSECSTSSDRNFSITVCNQIEGLSNIRITLSHSPGSDSTTSTDKGIKVEVQFSNQHSVTGGAGELCTPVAGQDDSGNLRQSVESPRVPTPHRSPASARKRKLFGDDSS